MLVADIVGLPLPIIATKLCTTESSQAGLPKIERTARRSIITPYLPSIIETLNTYPTLTAERLYEMAKARGYPGRPSHFRHRISELRC